MINKIDVAALLIVTLVSPAFAVDRPAGAPAAPSGAPEGAAKSGSSEAGVDASKNEMKSQNSTHQENSKMSDPNKTK